MLNRYHTLALASVLGLSAFAGSVSAASLPYTQQDQAASNTGLYHEVSRKRGNSDWWENNNNRRRGGHHHRRGHRDFDNFGIFVSPLIIGGGYGYHDGYRRSGSAHVEWCFSRYPNSYNPADNTWVSYSGEVNFCRSPYRY